MTKETGGPAIYVSFKDKILFKSNKWRIGSNGYVYKVGGRLKGRKCLLHRIIMNAKFGQEIHHINGNKLDNRRSNLFLTTASDHQKYHKEEIINRNKKRRKYPLEKICIGCGITFVVPKDHRDRNKYCSLKCALKNKWRFKNG